MTEQEKTELLSSVLHALLGDKFKGEYFVEVKLTTTLDADDIKDAKAKGIEYAKNNPDKWNAFALKVIPKEADKDE